MKKENRELRIEDSSEPRNAILYSLSSILHALFPILCFCSLAAAQEAPADTTHRLVTEEQRQLQVNQKLDGVLGKLSWVMDDLKSNALFEESGGPKLATMHKTVGEIDGQHVPAAVDYLRKAREQAAARRAHLSGADTEIETILQQLRTIVEASSKAYTLDSLLAELRVIIKRQEQLRTSTADWGKLLAQGAGEGDARRGELSRGQQEIGVMVKEFAAKLPTAAAAEPDPATKQKLTKSADVMQQGKIDDVIASAAGQIEASKPVGATGDQDKTLAILKEVEKILTDNAADPLKDPQTIADLKSVIEAEKQLQNKLEQTKQDQFSDTAPQAQLEQKNIEKQLDDVMKEMKSKNLEEASKDMKGAEKAMEQTALTPAREAVAEAIKNLEAAEKEAETQEQVAEATPEEVKTDENGEKPEEAMGEKEEGQHEGEHPHPGDHPEEAGGEEHGGTHPGAHPHSGGHLPVAGNEKEKGAHQGKGGDDISERARDPKQGPRTSPNSMKVVGTAKTGSADRIKVLGAREGQTLSESYEQELPPEYRELLKDYYEALGK